jgi:hypothetical protein
MVTDIGIAHSIVVLVRGVIPLPLVGLFLVLPFLFTIVLLVGRINQVQFSNA